MGTRIPTIRHKTIRTKTKSVTTIHTHTNGSEEDAEIQRWTERKEGRAHGPNRSVCSVGNPHPLPSHSLLLLSLQIYKKPVVTGLEEGDESGEPYEQHG